MAEKAREPAICIYATDFSETSQVVHLLARESGVVHLLAKGSKRPKSSTGGPLDLLIEGEAVFIPPRPESMGTLTEFSATTHHSRLRSRLPALHAGLYLVEVVAIALAEADPHPEVFDLLSAALRRLDEPDAPAPAVVAWFQWRLLQQVGLLGELTHCVGCGKVCVDTAGRTRPGSYFSSRLGGLLCRECETPRTEKFALDAPTTAALAALRSIQQGRRVPLPDDQAHAVNRLLAYHLTDTLGKPLKMLRHLKT